MEVYGSITSRGVRFKVRRSEGGAWEEALKFAAGTKGMQLKILKPDLLHHSHELQEDVNSDLPGPLKTLAAAVGGLAGRFRDMKAQNQQRMLHDALPEPSLSAHESGCVPRGRTAAGRSAASQFVLAALPGSSGMFMTAEDCTVVILSDTVLPRALAGKLGSSNLIPTIGTVSEACFLCCDTWSARIKGPGR